MENKNNKIVYFAGAIRGDRNAAEMMQEIIVWLKSENIKVLTEHIADASITDGLLTAEEIEKRDINWLDQATYIIAEISGASTGTGREIEYARVKGKLGKTPAQILCLYHSDREFYASPMIRGMDSGRYPNVTVRAYRDTGEAKDIIRAFLMLSR